MTQPKVIKIATILLFITLTSGFVAYRSGYFEIDKASDKKLYNSINTKINILNVDSPIVNTQDSGSILIMSDADRTMMYSSKSAIIFDDKQKKGMPHLFFDSASKKEIEKKILTPASTSKSTSVGVNSKPK